MIVYAATEWPTNGHLIEACAELGYLRSEWLTLDPTYGKGNWWTRFRPSVLVKHDLALDGVDFRHLPEPDNHFAAVAYDPPYVSVGGRATTGIPAMHGAYGLTFAPNTPAKLQIMMNQGLGEMKRVVKPRGFILMKCQDYVSSGKLWLGTHRTLNFALGMDLEVVDRLEHISGPRPQPRRSYQVHARRNLSTLFVFRKKK